MKTKRQVELERSILAIDEKINKSIKQCLRLARWIKNDMRVLGYKRDTIVEARESLIQERKDLRKDKKELEKDLNNIIQIERKKLKKNFIVIESGDEYVDVTYVNGKELTVEYDIADDPIERVKFEINIENLVRKDIEHFDFLYDNHCFEEGSYNYLIVELTGKDVVRIDTEKRIVWFREEKILKEAKELIEYANSKECWEDISEDDLEELRSTYHSNDEKEDEKDSIQHEVKWYY